MKKIFLFLAVLVFFACTNRPFNLGGCKYRAGVGVLIVGLDPNTSKQRAEAVLAAAKKLDVQWIRLGMIWAAANPAKGEYDFSWYDWLFDEVKKDGFKLMVGVMYTPKWVSAAPDSSDFYMYPPTDSVIDGSATGYAYLDTFARVIANRYAGIVDSWECWNEPDMIGSLKNPDTDETTSDEFAKMLAAFYHGIKQGNKQALVLSGGLVQLPDANLCEQGYLEQLLTYAKRHNVRLFDILDVHTNFKSLRQIQEQIDNDRITLSGFNHSGTAIWVSETSYTSDSAYQTLAGYMNGQAGLAKYVYDALKQELDLGAKVVIWASLNDYGQDIPVSPAYVHSGLLRYDLTQKQAGESFKTVAQQVCDRQ